jgi:hypothetical protein
MGVISNGLREEKNAGIMGGDPNKTSNYLFQRNTIMATVYEIVQGLRIKERRRQPPY